MLKTMLVVLLVPLGYLIGAHFAKRYKNRVAELSQCDNMLLKLTMYIEMQNMPTADVIKRLATSESLSKLRFLTECSDLLKESKDFPRAWRQSFITSQPFMALNNEDIALLSRLSEVMGIMGKEGIASSVALMRAELAQSIKLAELLSSTKGALLVRLGVLMGILAAILLI